MRRPLSCISLVVWMLSSLITSGYNSGFAQELPPRVIWTAVFNYYDDAIIEAIAVGPDGNPVVTGGNCDLLRTTKFDGRSGAVQWNLELTGEISGDACSDGMDVAIGLDGNPVVTGTFSFPGGVQKGMTIKCDGTTGAVIWSATACYIGRSVAIGPDANPVVTGDCTIKYDAATGAPILSFSDGGEAVAIGLDGNPVILAGNLTKYDGRNGSVIWSVPSLYIGHVNPNLAIGPDGSPFALDHYHHSLVKHDGCSGSVIWAVTPNDSPITVSVGADGNPVVGQGVMCYGGSASGVSKFDGVTGSILWQVALDYDEASRCPLVAVGPDGNPFVATTIWQNDPSRTVNAVQVIKYGYMTEASTPTGTDVTVTGQVTGKADIGAVGVTFSSVSDAGTTTISSAGPGTLPPSDFSLITPPIAFDVRSTASFSGPIRVCVSYCDDPAAEAGYRLFHNEGGTLVDRTIWNDTAANTICAEVPSLSSFVVLRPAPILVSIDIKPGSYPNTINLGAGGVVPVAILSSAKFDAATVDPASITLASSPVRLKGKGTLMASLEDINGDGLLDLIVHVDTQALQLSQTNTEAVLEGRTLGGKAVKGTDTVRVVP